MDSVSRLYGDKSLRPIVLDSYMPNNQINCCGNFNMARSLLEVILRSKFN